MEHLPINNLCGKDYICTVDSVISLTDLLFSLQDEGELEQLMKMDNEARGVVGKMRQKVEEAKSSLSSNRSRGKVLDALMQQKKSGRIPGILGRLVKRKKKSISFINCYSEHYHATYLSRFHMWTPDNVCRIFVQTFSRLPFYTCSNNRRSYVSDAFSLSGNAPFGLDKEWRRIWNKKYAKVLS